MSYHEKKRLQEFDKGRFSCVNTVFFCMFGNEKDAEKVFEFLNGHHKKIKITLEKENNKYRFLIFLSNMKETVF